MSDLEKDIIRAETILSFFTDPVRGQDIKKLIPPSVLARAHGIVFIRLYRVGLLVSAKGGNGIIIARLPDGSWSAPSGVSMNALGFGHQAGGEIIDSIIVMNYRGAVKAFFDSGGQLQLGINASVAAGPLGRSADVSASATSMNHVAATFAYSASKGLFVGYSFEGSKISERVRTNAAFYGRQISAREILTGAVPPPQQAAGIYNILYSIGATGPQPGITFGPVRSAGTNSYYPLSPQVPGGSFHSGNSGSAYNSPVTTPNGYPVEKQPRYGASSPSHNRASLQPSSSIRNPPQVNPRHSQAELLRNQYQSPHSTTSDSAGAVPATVPVSSSSAPHQFTEPPPPYEPGNTSSSNNSNDGSYQSFPNASLASSSHMPGNDVKQSTGYFSSTAAPSPTSPNQPHPSQDHQHQTVQLRTSVGDQSGATTLPSPSSSPRHNQTAVTQAAATAIPSATASSSHYQPASIPSSLPTSSKNNVSFVVVAKYDFNGQEQGDLAFKAGDHITVTQWTDDRESWWHGQMGSRSGSFPANYTDNL